MLRFSQKFVTKITANNSKNLQRNSLYRKCPPPPKIFFPESHPLFQTLSHPGLFFDLWQEVMYGWIVKQRPIRDQC